MRSRVSPLTRNGTVSLHSISLPGGIPFLVRKNHSIQTRTCKKSLLMMILKICLKWKFCYLYPLILWVMVVMKTILIGDVCEDSVREKWSKAESSFSSLKCLRSRPHPALMTMITLVKVIVDEISETVWSFIQGAMIFKCIRWQWLNSRAGPQSQAREKKLDPKKVDFDEGVFIWRFWKSLCKGQKSKLS